jgi:hypothetical protein
MTAPRRSPTLRRRRLSAELRRLRDEAGLTSVQATKALEWSSGRLTKMERGEWVRPNPRDVKDLLDLYQVTDQARRCELITLAREGRERGWWHPYKQMISPGYSTYIGLEAGAAELRAFEPVIVPGLLQTPNYARAVIAGGPDELSPEDVERRVEIRTHRQILLTRDDDPIRLWMVLDEAALRRQVGGPEVMRGQFRHIIELADLARVTVQVLPFSVGAHAGVGGAFTILRFPDPLDPAAVYVDTPAGELFVEAPDEVDPFRVAFQRLQAVALSPVDSLSMIAALCAET